ncbi:MAG: leucine--tRNA ligase [Candidatus Verstraetearchaeota archaeon]|nr:leucine--tRNA ligase [Candidatus Verstraetearchaeota archaeon]
MSTNPDLELNFQQVEEKWQRRWSESRIFEADPDESRPKFYVTVAYPYPNMPQHIGHARTYTLADVYARYKRMRGYNTLLPMAFHYTGTPILAQSKRIQSNDKELIEQFKSVGVSEDVIKTFDSPLNIARYFHNDLKLGMIEMGYSIDWRREFTTIDPAYSKFIEWQFYKLKSRGYITKGVHPIGWCPSCRNPVGQHDTKGDAEPEVEEFVAIKFIMDGSYLPAATLRPETIFGVTNIWVNPKSDYVEVEAGGERLILSKPAAKKFSEQSSGVKVIRELKGSTLVGKYAVNPLTGDRIPVLPADFVDPENATGVVMSVPAHAPYDLLAIMDLQNHPERLKEYGLDAGIVLSLKPIPVIRSPGLPEIPTVDLIQKLGVRDQLDPKAEEATKELYQREFHTGEMRAETGRYAGMPVSKAKEEIKNDLIRSSKAFKFYEIINGPIYCRCGAKVTVNLMSDQWFINYGDPNWKSLVKDHLNKMSILPEELREEFENVVDWLKEKACARRAGLGTPLPWDRDWIIESLSDSTIYMAFYTIAKTLNEAKIDPSLLTPEVFDYIFLGLGDPSSLKVPKHLLEQMRSEFLYFYPLDSRHSGRDLVPNHLTFFIFNHVAIFPPSLWPRQIVVNGSVLMEGKKMSKSLGNIIPLRKAIRMYGADTLRVSILSASELLQDADFSDSLARTTKVKLQEFYKFSLKYCDAPPLAVEGFDPLDMWLLSRVQRVIEQTTSSMENLRVREAIHSSFFILQQDIMWYLRRKGSQANDGKTRSVVRYTLETIIKLMAPFSPHICEELWERFGHKGFISVERWPDVQQSLIDERSELSEELVKGVIGDTSEILKVTGISPSKIYYYTSPRWKWEVYLSLLGLLESGVDPKSLLREAMKNPAIRSKGGAAAKFISAISSSIVTMPKDQRKKILSTGILDESEILSKNLQFLSEYFRSQVEVLSGESPGYDPKRKAEQALPMRPAIYIEGS